MAKKSTEFGPKKRLQVQLTEMRYEQNNTMGAYTYPSMVERAIRWSTHLVAVGLARRLPSSLKSRPKIVELQRHLTLRERPEISEFQQGEIVKCV